ncbi:MAG: DUF4440 domain-containing protein [Blastocatellia bacterium]
MNDEVTDVLRTLEERLLQAEVRQSATELAALLADDFLEVGSSGRLYNKQQVLAAVPHEAPSSISLHDFRSKVFSPQMVLVMYRATRVDSTMATTVQSQRSSLWQWLEGRWQLVFHQGTPIPETS